MGGAAPLVLKSNWKGKVVLLTGASSGIGEGLALALAARGAVVGLVARRRELLSELANRCSSVGGGGARIFPCDVRDGGAISAAAESLRADFGKIDVLIANAGVSGISAVVDPSEVRRVLEINFLGAVNSVAAVLPKMIERNTGQIVAVSSLAGSRGLPRSGAYAASKAAMNVFFESLRLDTADTGISVTIIQPGFIKTPLTAGRKSKLPFLMELDAAIPYFVDAIEKRRRFSRFPWPLAALVLAGTAMPASVYDRIAGRFRRD